MKSLGTDWHATNTLVWFRSRLFNESRLINVFGRNNFGSKKSCLMKCHPQGLYFHKLKKTIEFPTPPPWEIEDENDNNKKGEMREPHGGAVVT